MFKVVGVSKMKGKYKVRFANDMTRVKVLAKGGHEDIDLVEMPKATDKKGAVKFLMEQTNFTGESRAAIEAANAKYNGEKTVTVKSTATKPVKAISSATATKTTKAVTKPATPVVASPAAAKVETKVSA